MQMRVGKTIALVLLALGSFTITYASLGYFDPDELPAFVIEKLPLPHEELWLFALKVHVVAAAFALPACLLLVGVTMLKRAPSLHRWLGRVTGSVVLLGLVPSGVYMSWFAKGGVPSTVGFMLSGLIIAVAMVEGIRAARAREYGAHRRAVLHVLGQMSVAVTSRAMLYAFDAAAFAQDAAYLWSLWLPVLGTLAFIELFVVRRPTWRIHEAVARAHVLALRQPGLRRA
jgi:hypothetical protein